MNGRGADHATSNVYQKRLPRLQLAELEYIMLHRKYRFGQTGRFNKTEATGYRKAMCGIHGNVFGISSPSYKRTYAVAWRPMRYRFATCFYHPGHFQPGNIRYY